MVNNIRIYYHYFCTENSFEIFKDVFSKILKSYLYTQLNFNCDNKFTVNVVGKNWESEIEKLKLEYSNFTSVVFTHYRSDNLKNLLNSYNKNDIDTNPYLIWGKSGFEGDTLELLYNDVISHSNKHNILYLHSKGSVNNGSAFNWENRETWRNDMIDFVVLNWKTCIDELIYDNHKV